MRLAWHPGRVCAQGARGCRGAASAPAVARYYPSPPQLKAFAGAPCLADAVPLAERTQVGGEPLVIGGSWTWPHGEGRGGFVVRRNGGGSPAV